MPTRIVQFLALVFTALALIPGGAHLFSLPNKIGMTEQQYLVAQRAYDNWSLMGLVLIPAMLFNLALAWSLRKQRPAFYLAAGGALCMASTLAVFFVFTYPANVATQNWTVATANWENLRVQWEYSHAGSALLNFAAFCLVALACIVPRR
jgi:uncharacterized membrane protein